MDPVATERVRGFNRTVTQRVGALSEEYLARGRPLGASRVLWEIGDRGLDVRSLTATFDRAMDAATITGQTFLLRDSANVAVAATVSYDCASQTARITPTSPLGSAKVYTAQLTTAVRAADGTPLAATVRWWFTTADCPCSLLGGVTPRLHRPRRGRRPPGHGPDLRDGHEVHGRQDHALTAIRFYKDAGETGTHVGRLWNASGTQIGSATFAGETASGWQRATLTSPVTLTANATYTVSVGLNTPVRDDRRRALGADRQRPAAQRDAANGVFGNAAGHVPGAELRNVELLRRSGGLQHDSSTAPSVTSRTPVSGATGVDTGDHRHRHVRRSPWTRRRSPARRSR